MTLGAAAVRGNHDDMALSAYSQLQQPEHKVLPILELSGVPIACSYIVLHHSATS